METIRKIIHIDMDAFFASVEQRDHPELRGKPVAVGGGEDRGVVAAASYEARKFGIHSAMPGKTARKKCPTLIFIKPRMEIYAKVSAQIHKIFQQYTDLVEPLSLDEAFLDVTVNKKQNPSALHIAQELKQKIKQQTGLTASAGISINKFLAKVASDYQKPDGCMVITPEQAPAFIDALPIEKFHGIGRVTAEKMRKLNIKTGQDLKKWSQSELVRTFGKAGTDYYAILWNQYQSPVNPHRIRKSIGAEATFRKDISHTSILRKALEKVARETWRRAQKHKIFGKNVTLKIKFSDFQVITRSRTFCSVIESEELLVFWVLQMLPVFPQNKKIRLLGVSLAYLEQMQEARQLRFGF